MRAVCTWKLSQFGWQKEIIGKIHRIIVCRQPVIPSSKNAMQWIIGCECCSIYLIIFTMHVQCHHRKRVGKTESERAERWEIQMSQEPSDSIDLHVWDVYNPTITTINIRCRCHALAVRHWAFFFAFPSHIIRLASSQNAKQQWKTDTAHPMLIVYLSTQMDWTYYEKEAAQYRNGDVVIVDYQHYRFGFIPFYSVAKLCNLLTTYSKRIRVPFYQMTKSIVRHVYTLCDTSSKEHTQHKKREKKKKKSKELFAFAFDAHVSQFCARVSVCQSVSQLFGVQERVTLIDYRLNKICFTIHTNTHTQW